MTSAILTEVWSIAFNDAFLKTFWASAQKSPPGQVQLHLGEAPEDPPMPYIVYDITAPASPGGEIIWPMQDVSLDFFVYDYAPTSKRCLQMAEYLKGLFAARRLECNADEATAVRTYEPLGPHPIETKNAQVHCRSVRFPLRGYDVLASSIKLQRDALP